jgi:hypothetical protein
MKEIIHSTGIIVLALVIAGCAGTTPIAKLGLPPVSIIEGMVTQIDESGFNLMDSSGSIYVKAELPEHKTLNLLINEKIKVYGNLEGGHIRIFDGYVIKKSSGEQIIVTNPTPHLGFIIQSSFK